MKRKDRSAWIRAGLDRLADQGIESVCIEPLAKQLGVTKGSFYWHFRNREDLYDAMLEEWAATATEGVIERSESAGVDSKLRLQRLVQIAASGFDGRLEMALRSWAQREPAAARVLEDVDRRRLGYLRGLLRESGFEARAAETRAFLLYSALLGDFLLPEAHGRFSRKRILEECAELLGSA